MNRIQKKKFFDCAMAQSRIEKSNFEGEEDIHDP